MTRESAIAKVMKLRALAADRSATPDEAEAARRRAEILITNHELTNVELHAAELEVKRAQGPRQQPPPPAPPPPAHGFQPAFQFGGYNVYTPGGNMNGGPTVIWVVFE